MRAAKPLRFFGSQCTRFLAAFTLERRQSTIETLWNTPSVKEADASDPQRGPMFWASPGILNP